MYEPLLTCLSVNNATDSKMSKILVCPTIEVKTYLKTEGRAMNITILADYWLETCYDVMWQCVNLVYWCLQTDLSLHQIHVSANKTKCMRSGQHKHIFTLFLCFAVCFQSWVWFLRFRLKHFSKIYFNIWWFCLKSVVLLWIHNGNEC